MIRPFFHKSVYMSDVKITRPFFHNVFTNLSQVCRKICRPFFHQSVYMSVVNYVDNSFTRFSQICHKVSTSLSQVCHKICRKITLPFFHKVFIRFSQDFHKSIIRFPQVYRKSDVKICRPFYRQTVYMSNATFSELSL